MSGDNDDAEPSGPRQHSASSIALANRCRHAWALRYIGGFRPAEIPWSVIADWELTHGRNWWFSPTCEYGGQRGAALGKEVHRRAELYCVDGAAAVEWDDLPGQILQSMIDLLPHPGTVPSADVEHAFTAEMCGVVWRGLIDIYPSDPAAPIVDHKTSKDVAAYCLLPDAAALELGLPERAISADLQCCIYVLYRSIRTLLREVPVQWNYVETDKIRRCLPVVQVVDAASALTVVARAAEVAIQCEAYSTPDDAPPDAMRCDDYGGCWLRGRQCFAKRPWGRLLRQWEKTTAPATEPVEDRTDGSSKTTELRGSQGRGGARGRSSGKAGAEAPRQAQARPGTRARRGNRSRGSRG